MAMVEDANARNTRPLFVIDKHDVMRYVGTPWLANLPGRDPMVALDLTGQPGSISSSNQEAPLDTSSP
jgi:hypothetical protein